METLRETRLGQGLSQKELSALSGITQGNISLYENGSAIASPENKQRLEKVLGTHIDWFTKERLLISADFTTAHKLVKTLHGVYSGLDSVEKLALRKLLRKYFSKTNNK